jgi:hypothetical protein
LIVFKPELHPTSFILSSSSHSNTLPIKHSTLQTPSTYTFLLYNHQQPLP